ncbi:Growth inhibitor PemK [Skermania piniformis]
MNRGELWTVSGADAPTARIAMPTTTGIVQPGFAMIDKITTVRRSNLDTRIGRVPAASMAEVERSLLVFLGLAS